MAFQPAPVWANPIEVNKQTGEASFSSVWLRWFLDLVSFISSSGGGGGTGAVHDSLSGLQGGAANQYYHMDLATFNALTGVSGSITPTGVTVGAGRFQGHQGASLPAANNLTVGLDGNYFPISGATQINLLDSTGWQGGSEVTLRFTSNPLVKHNQGASGAFKSIKLAGDVDFATAVRNSLTLRYDSTDAIWYESCRKV